MIQRIKKEIANFKIFNINIQNSSYLPNWRLGRNYSNSSSAMRSNGGGVVLDISHELDFIQYLFGEYTIDYTFNKKISCLKINTDDILLLNGHIKKNKSKKIMIQLNLNFFSSISKREISIDGEKISIFGDLINPSLKISNHKKVKNISYKENIIKTIDKTYIDMHKSALKNDENIICTYDHGLRVVRDIDNIKKKNYK